MSNQLVSKVDGSVICRYFEKPLPNNSGYYCNHRCMYCFVNHEQLKRLSILEEENEKLRFMIDNGLGWEDVANDISDTHQPK